MHGEDLRRKRKGVNKNPASSCLRTITWQSWKTKHSHLRFQIISLPLSQSLRRRGAGGALVRGYNKETRHRQHRRCFFYVS